MRGFYYKMHQLSQNVTFIRNFDGAHIKGEKIFEIFKGKKIGSIDQKWVNWVNIHNVFFLK